MVDAARAGGRIDVAAVQGSRAIHAEADKQIAALRLIGQMDRLVLQLCGAVCQMVRLHPYPGAAQVNRVFHRPVCRAGSGGQHIRFQRHIRRIGRIKDHAPVVAGAPFLDAHADQLIILFADQLHLTGGGGVQIAPSFCSRRREGFRMIVYGKVKGCQRLETGFHCRKHHKGDLVGTVTPNAYGRIFCTLDRLLVLRTQTDQQILADSVLRQIDGRSKCAGRRGNGVGSCLFPVITGINGILHDPVFRAGRGALCAQSQNQIALAAGVHSGQQPIAAGAPLIMAEIAGRVCRDCVACRMGQSTAAQSGRDFYGRSRRIVVLPCHKLCGCFYRQCRCRQYAQKHCQRQQHREHPAA